MIYVGEVKVSTPTMDEIRELATVRPAIQAVFQIQREAELPDEETLRLMVGVLDEQVKAIETALLKMLQMTSPQPLAHPGFRFHQWGKGSDG